MKKINVIGAGLAGCEASYQLAKLGYEVHLYDTKPDSMNEAQSSKDLLAELVCSNSFKSYLKTNASGLLKSEMESLGSLFIEAANFARIEGSDDLVVDREKFSGYITEKIRNNPNIKIISKEYTELTDEPTILASGPLTSSALSNSLMSVIGNSFFSFFDAASPLLFASTMDTSKMVKGSKYKVGDENSNYLNILLNKDQYFDFVDKLLSSPKVMTHDNSHFEGCLPIEVIASRGPNTLRFGPMSPKGITEDKDVFAVIQLRQDDAAKTLYNMVGFQTNLTYQAQKELITSLPGLENVKFARFGLMHKNTCVNAPAVLNRNLSLKSKPNIFLAGQLSGVEGYVESAAMGLLVSFYVRDYLEGKEPGYIPLNTMLGSLVNYLVMTSPKHFAPMNATYGILYSPNKKDKERVYDESLQAIEAWKTKNVK